MCAYIVIKVEVWLNERYIYLKFVYVNGTNWYVIHLAAPDDVYDFLECATVGCRGQGHIDGPRYATHNSPKHCPYADDNIDLEHHLPDRLLSSNRQVVAAIPPISMEPREKM